MAAAVWPLLATGNLKYRRLLVSARPGAASGWPLAVALGSGRFKGRRPLAAVATSGHLGGLLYSMLSHTARASDQHWAVHNLKPGAHKAGQLPSAQPSGTFE